MVCPKELTISMVIWIFSANPNEMCKVSSAGLGLDVSELIVFPGI